MKKSFKSLFLVLILGVFAFSFYACGETPEAKFTLRSTEIRVGVEIDISEITELKNITVNDLVIKSSDSSIVYVKPNKNLVSRSEGVAVITIDGFFGAMLEINVIGFSESFDAPANVTYNEEQGRVVWDAVYKGTTVATEYEVKITNGGGASATYRTERVNTNYYNVVYYGDYTFSVRALGTGSVGTSEYSDNYSFKLLGYPYGIKYNDKTKTLEWNAESGISDFQVIVNGVATAVHDQKTLNLTLATVDTYVIEVASYSNSEGVFGRKSNEKLTLIRTQKPNLSVLNGEIIWDNEGNDIVYNVSLTGAKNSTVQINGGLASKCSYAMDDIKTAGLYDLTVYAMGDTESEIYTNGLHYLKSESDSLENIQKLASCEIDYNKLENKIYVRNIDASSNYKFSYLIYKDGKLVDTGLTYENIGSYINYDLSEKGVYSFKVKRLAQSEKQINSDYSKSVSVYKLGSAEGMTQEVVNGVYSLSGYEIENAKNYTVKYYNETLGQNVVVGNILNVNTVFANVGEYSVELTASNTDDLVNKVYYISSVTKPAFRLYRLADVENMVNDGTKITWNEVEDLQNLGSSLVQYSYILKKTNDLTFGNKTGVLDNAEFDYSYLDVGTYNIEVYATATAIDQNIVLSSLSTTNITFKIEKVLTAPNIAFVKDGGRYYVTVSGTENDKAYTLTVNNMEEQDYYTGVTFNNGRFDVTNIINNDETQWNIVVGVVGDTYQDNSKNYYIGGATSSLQVQKLATPSNVKVSANESIVVNSVIGASETEILILNEDDSTAEYVSVTGLSSFETSSHFSVKVKYVSKNEAAGGVYYVDSDELTFRLAREVVTSEFNIESGEFSFQAEDATNFTKTLYIKSLATLKELSVPMVNTTYNAYSYINVAGLDVSNGINISVKYTKGEFVIDGTNEIYKLSSFKTSALNIYKDLTLRNIELFEQGENFVAVVNIKPSGAVYKSTIGNDLIKPLSEFETGEEYTHLIEEDYNGEINLFAFTVSKLNKITELSVNDEVLSGGQNPNSSGLIISKTDLSDLGEIEELDVTAYYSAKQDGSHFYLSSDINTFKFKRYNKFNVEFNDSVKIYPYKIDITKEDEITGYKYTVVFSGSEDEFDLVYTAAEIVSINITEQLTSSLYALGNNKVLKIQKTSLITKAIANETDYNYLSSVLSGEVEIRVLEVPTDVVIEAKDGYIQDNLTISWAHQILNGYSLDKYIVSIYKDGAFVGDIETNTYIDLDNASEYLSESGKWKVVVKAVGKDKTISSNPSDAFEIIRLTPSNQMNISTDGNITFRPVNGASKYVLLLADVATNGATLNKEVEIENTRSSYQLTADDLELAYDGEIIATVYAVGDGITTLSSKKVVMFQKLVAPNVELTNNSIKVLNYNENVNYVFTARIDNKIVASGTLNGYVNGNGDYEAPYPDSYTYADGNKQVAVDFSTNKDVSFAIYATSKNSSALDSNIVVKNATILANLSAIGFKRDENEVVHFYISNPDTFVNNTGVTILGNVPFTSIAVSGVVDIELTDEVLSNMPNSFTITFYAIGGKVDDNVYLDSKTTQVNGTRLDTTKNITTNDGKLIWDSVSMATNYSIVVDEEEFCKNNLRVEPFTSLEPGEHIVKIKAFGNVAQEYLLENVVLDSCLTEGQDINKLDMLKNISSKLGFITFDNVDVTAKYIIDLFTDLSVSSTKTYELGKFEYTEIEETFSYYYNEDLRTLLKDGNEYYAKLYLKAVNEFDISSDYSTISYDGVNDDYIVISQFGNDGYNIELFNPATGDSSTMYLTTKARFTLSNEILNGYLLKLDGVISVKTSSEIDRVITLDEDGTWKAGVHSISYSQIGSNGIEDGRKIYLTPDFGKQTQVTKLPKSTLGLQQLSQPRQIVITYSNVQNADKYYVYQGEGDAKFVLSKSGYIDPKDISTGEYNSFGVRAVCVSDVSILAGDISYLTYEDEIDLGDEEVETQTKIYHVNKPQNPSEMVVKDGALMWYIDDTSMLMSLYLNGYSETPFYVFMEGTEIKNRLIEVVFTDEKNTSYTYQNSALNFMYFADNVINTIRYWAGDDAADSLEKIRYGFPSNKFGFDEFASNLPAGTYTVKYRILGNEAYLDSNSDKWLLLTSNYTTISEKYIPSTPEKLKIVNEGGIFSLRFESVNVTGNYTKDNVDYVILASYKDDDGNTAYDKIYTYQTANKSGGEVISISLTDLVNNNILTEKYLSLEVYVAGDNGNVLNSKHTAPLAIKVLGQIEAYVNHGILHWKAQEGATKYVIDYSSNVIDVPATNEGDTQDLTWLANGLSASEYNLSMYAYGSSEGITSNNGVSVITGKLTVLGKIIKLKQFDQYQNTISVQNGLFVWSEVENASGYDVYTVATDDELDEFITINRTEYETEAGNTNSYNYYFRSVGTEDLTLGENTTVYLTSDISDATKAKRIASVSNVKIYDGIITWTPELNDSNIYYKLTFAKPNNIDFEPIVKTLSQLDNTKTKLLIGDRYSEISGDTIVFDTNDLNEIMVDHFSVVIQAYYPNKTLSGDNALVISSGVSKTFDKLPEATNIQVKDGFITWDYEDVNVEHFFKLTFTKVGYGKVERYTNLTSYEDVIYDYGNEISDIGLTIKVIPGKLDSLVDTDFVTSKNTVYENTLTQIAKIDESKISTDLTPDGNLIISWQKAVSGIDLSKYSYQVKYKFGDNGVYTDGTYESSTLFVLDDFSDTDKIYIQLRVIPKERNYITSAWSEERIIEMPKTVGNLIYDSETYSFSWDVYGEEYVGSIQYIIRDEVGTYENATFVPISTYRVLAEANDNYYEPFEIGTHRVSVAVTIKGATSGLVSNFVTYDSIVMFDIYGGGDGTSENPYLIENIDQFVNLKYRASKDAKNNSYYKLVDDEDVLVQLSGDNTKYNFKQTLNLEIDNDSRYKSDMAFNGIYDGDFYKLTLTFIANEIAIFNKIGRDGTLKNIEVGIKENATLNVNNGFSFAVLAYENRGLIENIRTFNSITFNNIRYSLNASIIAFNNYGSVKSVEVCSDVNITRNTKYTVAIAYAPITVNNFGGTISYVRSLGNIETKANSTTMAGVVVNVEGGEILDCSFEANIRSYIASNVSVNIGGIVATVSDGNEMEMKECYVIGDLTLTRNVTLSNVSIGGLIGKINGGTVSLSYCYTNITVNNNTQGDSTYTSIYELIGYVSGTNLIVEKLYYNSNSNLIIGGSLVVSGTVPYTGQISAGEDLFVDSNFYDNNRDENDNPLLDWESIFVSNWKSDALIAG